MGLKSTWVLRLLKNKAEEWKRPEQQPLKDSRIVSNLLKADHKVLLAPSNWKFLRKELSTTFPQPCSSNEGARYFRVRLLKISFQLLDQDGKIFRVGRLHQHGLIVEQLEAQLSRVQGKALNKGLLFGVFLEIEFAFQLRQI